MASAPDAPPVPPLRHLDAILVSEADRIEDFLAYHRSRVLCPVATSVDIRRNACKAAVVDTNAFPAGFNNLARRSRDEAVAAIARYVGRVYPAARSVALVAESHTRNPAYYESLVALQRIFEQAGFPTRLGTLRTDLAGAGGGGDTPATVPTLTGHATLHALRRSGDALLAGGTVPDLVVLNNDLSTDPPELFEGLRQPVTPPPALGWHRRRKSDHFAILNELTAQLGRHVGFDPWSVSAVFERVDGVDFKERAGLDRIAAAVDRVVAAVAAKYDEYGIGRAPHAFVKADAGTYGMGVMSVASGEELLRLNARGRERMDRGKGRAKTSSVIVQEGVPSDLRVGTSASLGRGDAGAPGVGGTGGASSAGGAVAEPVVYMVCGRVVGGFHRVHAGRSDTQSLNVPGSTFEPMAFLTHGAPGPDEAPLDSVSAHVYQVLGEVASIATGYEILRLTRPDEPLPTYP